jgi:hypothetical protein
MPHSPRREAPRMSAGDLARGVAMLLLLAVALAATLAGCWHLTRADVHPRAGLSPDELDGGPLWWPSRALLSAEGQQRRARGTRLLAIGLGALALMIVLAVTV